MKQLLLALMIVSMYSQGKESVKSYAEIRVDVSEIIHTMKGGKG